ncbi:unnamed protein product, partial [Ectocarpus fasciculatus]
VRSLHPGGCELLPRCCSCLRAPQPESRGRSSLCWAADGRLPLRQEGPRENAAADEPLRRDVPRLSRHDRQPGLHGVELRRCAGVRSDAGVDKAPDRGDGYEVLRLLVGGIYASGRMHGSG